MMSEAVFNTLVHNVRTSGIGNYVDEDKTLIEFRPKMVRIVDSFAFSDAEMSEQIRIILGAWEDYKNGIYR